MLELLRNRARNSELPPAETLRRILSQLSDPQRFENLVKVAKTEPPRVRAMLGAIGQQLRKPQSLLNKLKDSLNPATRYDFGVLAGLKYAPLWYAKVNSGHETF